MPHHHLLNQIIPSLVLECMVLILIISEVLSLISLAVKQGQDPAAGMSMAMKKARGNQMSYEIKYWVDYTFYRSELGCTE